MSRPYYKVTIHEMGRPNPRSDESEDQCFNIEHRTCWSEEDVFAYLKERYGDNYKPHRDIYQDYRDGKSYVVGFIRSYWNKDWSHNSKSWWQTDWVAITKIQEEAVVIQGKKLVAAVPKENNNIASDDAIGLTD